MKQKLLRLKQVQERVPFSRTTLWRMEREGKFPKRYQLGLNSVVWLESEIDKWIANKVSKPVKSSRST